MTNPTVPIHLPKPLVLPKFPRATVAAALAAFALAGLQPAWAIGLPGLDGNADGTISYAELLTFLPEMSEGEFADLDLNGSGSLESYEIAAGTKEGLLPAE